MHDKDEKGLIRGQAIIDASKAMPLYKIDIDKKTLKGDVYSMDPNGSKIVFANIEIKKVKKNTY